MFSDDDEDEGVYSIIHCNIKHRTKAVEKSKEKRFNYLSN